MISFWSQAILAGLVNWAQDYQKVGSTCEKSMVSWRFMFYEMYEEDRICDVFHVFDVYMQKI